MKKNKASQAVSYGLAATGFVCLTRIFGIPDNSQTPDMLLSANCFAIWLPIQMGAAWIYKEAIKYPTGPKWIQGVAAICLSGDLFLKTSLAVVGVLAIALPACYFADLRNRPESAETKTKGAITVEASESVNRVSMMKIGPACCLSLPPLREAPLRPDDRVLAKDESWRHEAGIL